MFRVAAAVVQQGFCAPGEASREKRAGWLAGSLRTTRAGRTSTELLLLLAATLQPHSNADVPIYPSRRAHLPNTPRHALRTYIHTSVIEDVTP